MSHAEPRIQVAIADTLFKSMQSLPANAQKPVYEFITKFRNNPRSPGIHYETIRNAREPNYRSVRITRDYRGIVLQPEQGNIYMLLWVDKHDDAYAWAERTRCTIHPATGSLQIYESQIIHEDTDDTTLTDVETAQHYEKDAPPLFDVSANDLFLLGVPKEVIGRIQKLIRVEQLVELRDELPIEAYEALTFLAEGEPLDEIVSIYGVKHEDAKVDTTDYATALQRPVTQRRFHIYTEDEELRRMLNKPLDEWRVYLHQDQRKYATWDVNGPIRILGGAGTGKTVVAMHRANWLVSDYLKESDERVLFTTFTANLASDIEANLRSICTPEALARIDVLNLNAWVSRLVRTHGFDRRIVYDNDPAYEEAWETAEMNIPSGITPELSKEFYRDEWNQVVLPQNIRDQRAYGRAKRAGRGVALNRQTRHAIWPVFETLRAELARRHVAPFEDAVFEAIRILEDGGKGPNYRAVVVDEAQDFGQPEMQLLRAMVPENPNDIFIVGDAHQRIYGRRAPLSHAGINIVGRARRLRLNYRTSEEIRHYASQILLGVTWDDLDTGTDKSDDYKSLFHSEKPHLQGFQNSGEETRWIASQIQELLAPGEGAMTPADICIVARTQHEVERTQRQLEQLGVKSHRISRAHADQGEADAVRVATIHRVKGLGFRAVFLAGASEENIPPHQARRPDDAVEQEHVEQRERALLHVACTRAVSHLFVTWSHTRSALLPDV